MRFVWTSRDRQGEFISIHHSINDIFRFEIEDALLESGHDIITGRSLNMSDTVTSLNIKGDLNANFMAKNGNTLLTVLNKNEEEEAHCSASAISSMSALFVDKNQYKGDVDSAVDDQDDTNRHFQILGTLAQGFGSLEKWMKYPLL